MQQVLELAAFRFEALHLLLQDTLYLLQGLYTSTGLRLEGPIALQA